MSVVKFKSWFAGLCVLALVGCGGGGGSAGTSVLGGGAGTPILGSGNVGGPSLVVGISSPGITAQSPATVTTTIRDAGGVPISGVVVSFKNARTDIGQLSADSALTNSQGMGSVGLSASAASITGADTVTVTAILGTTTLTGAVGYSVTGATATLQAVIDSTTLRVSTGPVRFAAVVRDSAGNPLLGQVVVFASANGVVKVANPTALTDGAGVAATTVTPADGSVGAADTLIASTTVNGKGVQSSVNVQVVSESPAIALTVDRSQITSTAPATVQAIVRDANNLPVSGAVVSFSSQFGLGTFSAVTAATANVSGIATVALSPKSAGAAGADVIVATVTVNGVTRTAQKVVEFVSTVSAASPQLSIGISSSTVTPASPATVTMRLINGAGQPVVGAVVTLSTSRGNLGVLAATTVLTGPQGAASVLLQSSASGTAGADEVVAVASVQGQSLQATVGFTVDSSAPVIRLDADSSPVQPLRHSAGGLSVVATVLSSTGQPVVGQVVKFATTNSLVDLTAPSAVTLSDGKAAVAVRAKNASITGVESIVATTVLAGRTLQATTSIQLLAESPSVALAVIPAANSSEISSTAPATVRATVLDSSGAPVPGALVTFTSQAGLGVFDLKTVATASQGVGTGQATAKLSPATSSTAGADVVVATVTVAGVQVSAQKVVQFTASSAAVRSPILTLSLSSTSISSAGPAALSATLTDGSGLPVPGQVVTFSIVRGLALTNVATALTNTGGVAVAVLSPANSSVAGADEVVAVANVAGVALSASRGFQIQATNVTILDFRSAVPSLSAYGQTTLTLELSGASVGSPVNIAISSACASQGKATVSPATLTATTSLVTIQYRDIGCGAIQVADQLQAVIVGTASAASLPLGLTRPDVSSIAFVQALPEAIFLKGSGFTETSVVRFEVRDGAGNPLPNQSVDLLLLTGAGGVTVQNNSGVSVPAGTTITRPTDALGRVEIRVNSGSQPTPVRIQASISATIKTVSSNLSIGVGLPSQLNFSMSQQFKNIEGMNIDGTPNTYSIIASDRSGNPVPAGTSINFVVEGGQVEAIKQTSLLAGIARASAGFVSAEPRPEDGRVTVTAYALGEESFIDQNGSNTYEPGEPFQDLGDIFKDRDFNGTFVASVDETVPTNVANSTACIAASAALGSTVVTNALLALDPSIPSVPSTCDGAWSGAGKVYVRRAMETVLSTSAARPLWLDTRGLETSCGRITLQIGPSPLTIRNFAPVQGDTYYFGVASGSLAFMIADANTYRAGSPFRVGGAEGRLNPMAAGTIVSASTPTTGLKVTFAGGSPVPNTNEASVAVVGVTFEAAAAGVVFLNVTSPSGLATTFAIPVSSAVNPTGPGNCVP